MLSVCGVALGLRCGVWGVGFGVLGVGGGVWGVGCGVSVCVWGLGLRRGMLFRALKRMTMF